MSRSTRLTITLVAVVALVVGVWYGGRALWDKAKDAFRSDGCSISGYDLDPEQASVAATMVGAVAKHRPALPERASVLVLAAGLQESKLHNLKPNEGDRDSVGVLQQRPSQGWGGGHADVLNDVGEATKEFLDAMVKVPRWRTRPLAEVVQAVQISADGSAYAKHEPEALAIAQALDGTQPAGISCDFEAPTAVASTARVAQLVSSDLPIAAPVASLDAVHVAGAHWQTAAWFVAWSYQLGIERVDYDHHTWTRTGGWKTSAAPATEVVATMYRK
ncbi:MAG: hypothetical protein ACTHMS_13875 [Jatrophihabitans sp.]|uniref:hypothetical protein n=1 Tax=Jatrophihabitans sp. TaxID=1932789 RepID=UPI003F7F15BE